MPEFDVREEAKSLLRLLSRKTRGNREATQEIQRIQSEVKDKIDRGEIKTWPELRRHMVTQIAAGETHQVADLVKEREVKRELGIG